MLEATIKGKLIILVFTLKNRIRNESNKNVFKTLDLIDLYGKI